MDNKYQELIKNLSYDFATLRNSYLKNAEQINEGKEKITLFRIADLYDALFVATLKHMSSE